MLYHENEQRVCFVGVRRIFDGNTLGDDVDVGLFGIGYLCLKIVLPNDPSFFFYPFAESAS